MIKRKYTNAVNFEHTIFLTDPYIEFLLAKHGFKLIRKKFGNKVAKIVEDCTDTKIEPKPPWFERKKRYIENLKYKST